VLASLLLAILALPVAGNPLARGVESQIAADKRVLFVLGPEHEFYRRQSNDSSSVMGQVRAKFEKSIQDLAADLAARGLHQFSRQDWSTESPDLKRADVVVLWQRSGNFSAEQLVQISRAANRGCRFVRVSWPNESYLYFRGYPLKGVDREIFGVKSVKPCIIRGLTHGSPGRAIVHEILDGVNLEKITIWGHTSEVTVLDNAKVLLRKWQSDDQSTPAILWLFEKGKILTCSFSSGFSAYLLEDSNTRRLLVNAVTWMAMH
jgi:hypothetical protein